MAKALQNRVPPETLYFLNQKLIDEAAQTCRILVALLSRLSQSFSMTGDGLWTVKGIRKSQVPVSPQTPGPLRAASPSRSDHRWRSLLPADLSTSPGRKRSSCCGRPTAGPTSPPPLIDVPQRVRVLSSPEAGRRAAPAWQRAWREAVVYLATIVQQRLIKKRSVGPLELITNYFRQCHPQPCWGRFSGTSAKLKGFGL